MAWRPSTGQAGISVPPFAAKQTMPAESAAMQPTGTAALTGPSPAAFSS